MKFFSSYPQFINEISQAFAWCEQDSQEAKPDNEVRKRWLYSENTSRQVQNGLMLRIINQTRMHSSRMRTARSLPVFHDSLPSCAGRGVSVGGGGGGG